MKWKVAEVELHVKRNHVVGGFYLDIVDVCPIVCEKSYNNF